MFCSFGPIGCRRKGEKVSGEVVRYLGSQGATWIRLVTSGASQCYLNYAMRGRGGVILLCQVPVEASPLLFPEYRGGTDLYTEANPGSAGQQPDLF